VLANSRQPDRDRKQRRLIARCMYVGTVLALAAIAIPRKPATAMRIGFFTSRRN
jgi:hypothetical protein